MIFHKDGESRCDTHLCKVEHFQNIFFRILLPTQQVGKPLVPELQLLNVGPRLPAAPPHALLPAQLAPPSPPLMVPPQLAPPFPGQPARSPSQPSKPPTSRYCFGTIINSELLRGSNLGPVHDMTIATNLNIAGDSMIATSPK